MIAHLYNTSAELHGGVNQAVYIQKDTAPQVYAVGVLDIERGQREDFAEHLWQTDTSVGDWFYNVKDVYKTPTEVLETLVDIGSKNGNLVLNMPQKPDGTLDDQCDFLLRQMAVWMTANGEGFFGSRPWEVSGEGAAAVEAGEFKEGTVDWTPTDFRFTRKGDTVYACGTGRPDDGDGQALFRSFATGRTRRVAAVRLIGGDVPFTQTAEGLQITLPPSANHWPLRPRPPAGVTTLTPCVPLRYDEGSGI